MRRKDKVEAISIIESYLLDIHPTFVASEDANGELVLHFSEGQPMNKAEFKSGTVTHTLMSIIEDIIDA